MKMSDKLRPEDLSREFLLELFNELFKRIQNFAPEELIDFSLALRALEDEQQCKDCKLISDLQREITLRLREIQGVRLT